MKLINFKIESSIYLTTEKVSTLVVENPDFFAYIINELNEQSKGGEGDFLLFKNSKELNFSKSIMFVTDLINMNMNDRKIINKLYARLKDVAYKGDTYLFTQEVITNLDKYLNELIRQVDYTLLYEEIDLLSFFKASKIKFQEENDNILEKLVDYINVLIELNLAEALIVVHLKSYLQYEDLQELYKHCIYNDFQLLLIESVHQEKVDKDEQVLIIDKDLCEILVNH